MKRGLGSTVAWGTWEGSTAARAHHPRSSLTIGTSTYGASGVADPATQAATHCRLLSASFATTVSVGTRNPCVITTGRLTTGRLRPRPRPLPRPRGESVQVCPRPFDVGGRLISKSRGEPRCFFNLRYNFMIPVFLRIMMIYKCTARSRPRATHTFRGNVLANLRSCLHFRATRRIYQSAIVATPKSGSPPTPRSRRSLAVGGAKTECGSSSKYTT